VRLAARGARERVGGGVEPVADPEAVRQLKKQGSRVVMEALAIAVVVTAVVMLGRGLLAANLPPLLHGIE
jgi:hypothetical protein